MVKLVRLSVLAVVIAASGILPSHADPSEFTYVNTDTAGVGPLDRGLRTEAGNVAGGWLVLEATGGPVEVTIDDHALIAGMSLPVLIVAGGSSFNGCFEDGGTRVFPTVEAGRSVLILFRGYLPLACTGTATVGSLRVSGAN